MTVLQALLLVGAGLVAGFVAGLIGVGGGVIFTPMLFATYGVLEVPDGVRTPITVGTGLFCTGLAAASSAVYHYRRAAVQLRMALGVGLASAGAVGLVSRYVVTRSWYDATVFQLLFALVLLVVVVRLLQESGDTGTGRVDRATTGWGTWVGTGSVAGTVAASVGVGGGVVLVPAYSRWFRLPFHQAVGTSSATILIISFLSALAYAWLGTGVAGRAPLALGYVDVGTGLLLAGPAVLGAGGGAALAHRFDTAWLRWSFALLAVGVAVRLILGAIGG